jgi:acetyltransferase-like isoleucine patch superfamily enzyme
MKSIYVFILIYNIFNFTSALEELRIDLRESAKDKEAMAQGIKDVQNNHKFNLATPFSEEYFSLMKELFYNQIGENSIIYNQLTVVRPKNVTIGKNVTVMNGVLMMSAGGITIEDNVMIAANVQLISNNHDPYDRYVITCKPILIKEGAWIGAGATILPGVTIGKYAIIGANSLVSKDIPDYGVAVGSPAKVIKYLEKEKFIKN